MPGATQYSKQQSAFVTKTYAAIAADVNLVTDRPGFSLSDGGDQAEYRPRRIVVGGAGDLVVSYDEAGTLADTIPATAGSSWDISPTILSTATTATNITVHW